MLLDSFFLKKDEVANLGDRNEDHESYCDNVDFWIGFCRDDHFEGHCS